MSKTEKGIAYCTLLLVIISLSVAIGYKYGTLAYPDDDVIVDTVLDRKPIEVTCLGDSLILSRDLNDGIVFSEIIRQGLMFPHIVLAQAKLETGGYTSRLCIENNNLFGIKLRNGQYASFDTWEESITAYRDWIQYRFYSYTPEDHIADSPTTRYLIFLRDINYATDPDYLGKVVVMLRTIEPILVIPLTLF